MKKTSKFLNLIISLLGLILIFQACQSPNTTNEIKSKAEFVNTKNLNKDPFSDIKSNNGLRIKAEGCVTSFGNANNRYSAENFSSVDTSGIHRYLPTQNLDFSLGKPDQKYILRGYSNYLELESVGGPTLYIGFDWDGSSFKNATYKSASVYIGGGSLFEGEGIACDESGSGSVTEDLRADGKYITINLNNCRSKPLIPYYYNPYYLFSYMTIEHFSATFKVSCNLPTLKLATSQTQVGTSNGLPTEATLLVTSGADKPWTMNVIGPDVVGCTRYSKTYHGSGDNSSHKFPDGQPLSSLANGTYTIEVFHDDKPNDKKSSSVTVNNPTILEVTIPEGKGLNSEKIFSAKAGGQANFKVVAPGCPAWELKIDGKLPDVVNDDGTTTPGQACSFKANGTGNNDNVPWNGSCDKGIMADGSYTATLKVGSQSPTQTVKIDNTPPEIENVEIKDNDTSVALEITLKDPTDKGPSSGLDESSINLSVSDPTLGGTISKSGNKITYTLPVKNKSDNEQNELYSALENGNFKIIALDNVKNLMQESPFLSLNSDLSIDTDENLNFKIKNQNPIQKFRVGPNELPIRMTITTFTVDKLTKKRVPFIKLIKGYENFVINGRGEKKDYVVYKQKVNTPNNYAITDGENGVIKTRLLWQGTDNQGGQNKYVLPGKYFLTKGESFASIKTFRNKTLEVGTASASKQEILFEVTNCAYPYPESAPNLGNKLNYLFGTASGNDHTEVRTNNDLYRTMKSIGIFDTPENREYMRNYLIDVYNDRTNVSKQSEYFKIVKESILVGPNGSVKMESLWQCNEVTTFYLKNNKK